MPSRPKRWALLVLTLVAASQWIRLLFSLQGDFRLHWQFGQRMLRGEFLYLNGVHSPYPPFWGVWCLPTTLLPLESSWLVWYPIGLVWGGVLIWALVDGLRRSGLTPRSHSNTDHTFWTVMLGLALGSRYVIRELPENGVNLMIVALSWLGLMAWRRGCDGKAGVALGLAVALKCTPLIFVAFLGWRRQFRVAGVASGVAVLASLTPLPIQGLASHHDHWRTWFDVNLTGISQLDPNLGPLGEATVQNHALRPTLGRLLTRLPEGHSGRLDHPWELRGLGWEPRAAGRLIDLTVLVTGLLFLARFRGPIARRDSAAILAQLAALGVASLLISPITWKQHAVGLLPALFLTAAVLLDPVRRSALRLGIGTLAVLGCHVVFVLLLDRGVIGRTWSYVLDGWGVITLSWVGWAFLMWSWASRFERMEAAIPDWGEGRAILNRGRRFRKWRVPHPTVSQAQPGRLTIEGGGTDTAMASSVMSVAQQPDSDLSDHDPMTADSVSIPTHPPHDLGSESLSADEEFRTSDQPKGHDRRVHSGHWLSRTARWDQSRRGASLRSRWSHSQGDPGS